MKKKALIAFVAIVLLVGGVSIFSSVERSRARKALVAYKEQLHAAGEWLTLEDAGYPFALQTNANLQRFVLLADRLRGISSLPGELNYQSYSEPGRLVVAWAANAPTPSGGWVAVASPPTWEQLSSDCEAASGTLSELRVELEHPPRRFGWNYTNPFSMTPRNPFVQKRAVAQFLAADSLCALHELQLPRAQADLHALTQLAQVHRDDLTLVSAMIRVAVAGLGLSATWQALPAEGWDEASLLALQRDWEAIDLFQALETGFVGERIFGEQAFQNARRSSLNNQAKLFSTGGGAKPGYVQLKDELLNWGVAIYWRGHMEEDELFYLQQSQQRLEMIRRLKTNASAVVLQAEMKAQSKAMKQVMDAPLGKYQHLFSALAIPNYLHAVDVTMQLETERRLTIAVLALKRFQFKNGHFPSSLQELFPEFVTTVPIDPWSGKPMRYRPKADGTFVLYSVGRDGRDDGGDATSATATNAPDLWTGKDAVWPWPDMPVQM